jgi:Flp pilus assembly protein CpaB
MPLRRDKTQPQPEFDAGLTMAETRTRSRKLVVAGFLLALCAGVGSYVLLVRAQQSVATTTVPHISVVVAAKSIPARTSITPDDLAVRDVVADGTNAQGTFQSADEVVGRISSVAILQGQMVTSNLFAFSAAAGGIAILSPGESVTPDSPIWRASSLSVPDERAVGGQITAGAHVDIFVTTNISISPQLTAAGQLYSDKSTKIVYQDIPVLSKVGNLYVIKVTEQIAEEIAHLQASGGASFSLALRPDIDTRTVDGSKFGATTNIVIERYGLPAPQVYPQPGQAVNVGPAVVPPTPIPTPVQALVATPAPSATP